MECQDGKANYLKLPLAQPQFQTVWLVPHRCLSPETQVMGPLAALGSRPHSLAGPAEEDDEADLADFRSPPKKLRSARRDPLQFPDPDAKDAETQKKFAKEYAQAMKEAKVHSEGKHFDA